MASGDREISSRLGGVTVSRVSPSHSQAVVPPQVIHKSNRRGTRLPVTHNKEVTNNARNFFLLFFLSFFFFITARNSSQAVFSAFLPLLFPSSSDCWSVLTPTSARLATRSRRNCRRKPSAAIFFPFFLPLSLFFFLRSEVCVGRGILDTWIDKWKRFEEQLNCR